jgi:hypothetical protein
LVFYIPVFFLLWVAGTNVHSVMNHTHTQQNSLWTRILPNTIPGIKPGEKYSNVCFVTNRSLQKSVWIIISMPYMVWKEMLSKSVVIFDRDSADLLFPISFWTFLFLFYFDFYIHFLIFWMAGTNVTFVAAHTQPKVLCKTISVSTMASSNVNFVTNHTLQNCYCNFISIPNIDRTKILCKSVVVFTANLLISLILILFQLYWFLFLLYWFLHTPFYWFDRGLITDFIRYLFLKLPITRGVIRKLRWQVFCLLWPPTPLSWHFTLWMLTNKDWFPKYALWKSRLSTLLHSMLRQDLNETSKIREITFWKCRLSFYWLLIQILPQHAM